MRGWRAFAPLPDPLPGARRPALPQFLPSSDQTRANPAAITGPSLRQEGKSEIVRRPPGSCFVAGLFSLEIDASAAQRTEQGIVGFAGVSVFASPLRGGRACHDPGETWQHWQLRQLGPRDLSATRRGRRQRRPRTARWRLCSWSLLMAFPSSEAPGMNGRRTRGPVDSGCSIGHTKTSPTSSASLAKATCVRIRLLALTWRL